MADVSTINANGVDYNIKDATARSDISTINTTLSGLGDDMTAAEGNITSLGTRMTAAEGNITSLGTRMTAAEGDIDALEGNVSSLQTTVGNMFSQNYQSVTSGGTINLTIANTEPGFVVTTGADSDARGLIIYYANAYGTVSFTKAFGAEDVEITTSTNQLSLANNSSAYLFAMQFKG